MRSIILAPHLDDGAYSCGGWIWEQTQKGEEVVICTIFAASPSKRKIPPFAWFLEKTWHLSGDVYAGRRIEDKAACNLLRCKFIHLDFPDCIYRYLPGGKKPLVRSYNGLFVPIHPLEQPLVDQVTQKVRELIPESAHILAPLGVGGHIDHRITRIVAERLEKEIDYYLEMPYNTKNPQDIKQCIPLGAHAIKYSLSEDGLRAWQNSISAYPSQLRSFWRSTKEMEDQIKAFSESSLGCTFWRV